MKTTSVMSTPHSRRNFRPSHTVAAAPRRYHEGYAYGPPLDDWTFAVSPLSL
jgi:hypothetical protein